jgi:serine/threonine protein kinase
MSERSIFLAALERSTPAERVSYLDEACAGNPALRQRIEALLKSHEEADDFLEVPALEHGAEGREGEGRPGETRSDAGLAEGGELPLDFLAPSEKAGSLGRLGHYEVLEVVGRGGMGVVLKALDETLHRVVAIKVMAPQLATNATARKRFRRESQAAAAVSHDHVVTIHAVEEANGLTYIVMQYVAGPSLQERLDRTGPLELKEILRIGLQTAEGLAAAHKHGLIHRDIKPANILLENGVERVKITDFGLARAADDASLTQSGVIAGTPQYMAPEQARGEHVDHRADLFSLGSVLYAMCTGRAPFRASTAMAVLKRVCEEEPRPIRELNPDIPPWMEDLIARLHAKDPEDRFQSAKEVAELLGQHLAHLQQPALVPMPPRVARPPSPPRPAPRNTCLVAALVLAVLGAAGLGLLAIVAVAGYLLTGPQLLSIDEETAPLPLSPVVHPQSTFKLEPQARTEPNWLRRMVLSPDRRTLAWVLDDHTIKVWNLETGKERFTLKGQQYAVAFSPDSRTLAYCGYRDEQKREAGVVLVDLAEPAGKPRAFLGSPAGGKPRAFPTGLMNVDSLAFDSAGQKLAMCQAFNWDDGKGGTRWRGAVTVWDIAAQQEIATLKWHEFTIRALAFSPDAKTLAAAGEKGDLAIEGGNLVLWDVETGQQKGAFQTELKADLTLAAFSPDGKTLALGGAEIGKGPVVPSVVLWDVDGNRERAVLRGHRFRLGCLSFSPDGTLLASGDLGGSADSKSPATTRLWDVKTGQEQATLIGHDYWVMALAFSPDGKTLTSAGNDWTVKTWDVSPWTGSALATPPAASRTRRFAPPKDTPITQDGVTATADGWKIENTDFQRRTVRLFEVRDLDVKDCRLVFRLQMKTETNEKLENRQIFTRLETAFRPKMVIEKGPTGETVTADSWSALARRGNTSWAQEEATTKCLSQPEVIALHLLVEGIGTVWIKDVELVAIPLPAKAGGSAPATPFAILPRAGEAEQPFATLAQAVAAAHSDDTIEVRGNGPFITDPIRIVGRALTIRAADGFRPVLRLSPEAAQGDKPLLSTDAPLVLEGLDLQRVGGRRWESGSPTYLEVLYSSYAPLHAVNCRFILDRQGGPQHGLHCINTRGSPWCEVRNCQFFHRDGSFLALTQLRPGTRCVVSNCLIACGYGVLLNYRDTAREDVSIELTGNTFVGYSPLSLNLLEQPASLEKPAVRPIRVTASSNLWGGCFSCNQTGEMLARGPSLSAKEVEELLVRLIDRYERQNLYRPSSEHLKLTLDYRPLAPTRPRTRLADWLEFWQLPNDTGSLEGPSRFQRDDISARLESAAELLTPADFRLLPGAPGKGAGKDGRDLGADVDLVGLGPAYERWKQTPEYQQWLRDTKQVQHRP